MVIEISTMTKKLKPVADVSRKFSKSVQEKFLQQKKRL